MFHVADGLFFEPLPDGKVRIVKSVDPATDKVQIIFDQTLDANAWASVIASMSNYGEENGGFYRALSFHRGDVVAASAIPVEPDLRRQWVFKDLAGDAD